MGALIPVAPAAVAHLQPFADAGVLDAAEVHLAALLVRRAPGTAPEVALAAALAARAPRLGHVCIEPATVAGTVTVDGADPLALEALPWPDPATWAQLLAASPLVTQVAPGRPLADPVLTPTAEVPPLVYDGTHLTLDRYARYERSVATALLARVGPAVDDSGPTPLVPPDQLEALLDRLFGPEDPAVPDRQRQAARAGLAQRLAVIAGGPGTGKTRTVARLLAVAQEAAVAADRTLQVALVAPTGKAAARLTEAVDQEIGQVVLSPGVAERMRAAEASTIHRLLGWAGGIRFRHHAEEPLPHDLVVVDESSMASLPLVSRLLDAIRPDAHLVIVGDPDQLASVEAGAVLGEIVRAGATSGPLAPAVVVLDRVHRFGAGSAIAELARAVRDGDAAGALALLADPGRPDIALVHPSERGPVTRIQGEVLRAAEAVVRAAANGDAAGAWAAATATKVLTATRAGTNSRAAWEVLVERLLARPPTGLDTTARWYVGRPVMVTRNDPLTGLFNGDAGVLLATDLGPRVAFPGPEGARRFEPSRLAEVDTWWAMTIHKSQGSEFGHVVVALPDAPSPMLTRELLYTAVTRARSRVTVVATTEAVVAAVERRIVRASSLAGLLAPSDPGPVTR